MSVTSRVSVIPNHPRGYVQQSPRPGTLVDEHGGLYVTREQLERFGDGDAQWGRRELRAFLTMDRTGATKPLPTPYPKPVRIATPQDDANLLELLLVDLRENAALIAPIDEGRVMQTIQLGTHRRGGIAGIIDGPDGKPVAVTILHLAQWWFSQAWYYAEAVTFVHPEHRRSRHSEELIRFGMWAAEQQTRFMGYQFYFMCGVLGLTRFWTKTAMYRRKFMQVGSAFLHPSPNRGSRT